MQPLNKKLISCTLLVSKFDKFIEINDLQLKNIFCIVVTELVSKLDILILFNLLHS